MNKGIRESVPIFYGTMNLMSSLSYETIPMKRLPGDEPQGWPPAGLRRPRGTHSRPLHTPPAPEQEQEYGTEHRPQEQDIKPTSPCLCSTLHCKMEETKIQSVGVTSFCPATIPPGTFSPTNFPQHIGHYGSTSLRPTIFCSVTVSHLHKFSL